MQTPAPATRGSVFVPPLAAALQQDRTAQAVLRKTKISPKKLNEFARLIRRMHIDDALVQCSVAPNKAAKLCYKVWLPCLTHSIITVFLCTCQVHTSPLALPQSSKKAVCEMDCLKLSGWALNDAQTLILLSFA